MKRTPKFSVFAEQYFEYYKKVNDAKRESILTVKSQRYNLPSSLLASTDLLNGSMAAELMHHSRTAFGCAASRKPRSSVGSAIEDRPLDNLGNKTKLRLLV